ncbi:hypothetical protein KL942_004666 [Ogataea angusta]|uniref:Flavin-containing monooxygenase n=1 Tax=Pichia angusta TaxID=870730 RepID=A0ABQ7RS84_PICAN|nr:hypothetical protein KL909_004480 [Ogataea angusta]KAG7836748.1 hypothetical protein KL942_004666 [Ogataea angusta]KAG7846440.1 hypothetical protein KL940_004392 [Ogataea angusta]KAG7854271.1 hypothetical protein KL939_005019 [Ogataea angusta]
MKICIIGAGPAGVAMAKAVAMEPRNDLEIHVYERNASAGGLWNYTGKEKEKVSCTVPATDQRQARENTVPGIPYVSAMYEHLETNIVKDMMRYKDVQFPPECETFPTRQEVAEYVRKYAATIPENVRFHYNSTVVELEKHGSWQLTYRDTVSNALSTESFDYVILAQGHFDLPYIPEVRGLAEWNAADPASIIHAKYYNDVERFENKTVLVVGNSASGIDIATQLTTYAGRVIISAASPSPVADILIDNAAQIGKVDEYRVADRSVVTVDGETVSGVDYVIFCTGYLYSIPFLKSYTEGEHAILTTGEHVRYVYKQLFYIPDPTLINAALGKNIIPFPFAECQAQYVARVISGRERLPSREQMMREYAEEVAVKGDGKGFHELKYPADAEYCNHMFELIENTKSDGFVAEYWDEQRRDLRSRTGQIKAKRLERIVAHAQQLRQKHEKFRLLRG